MKILRAGLCALIAFCVLAHGVVEVWSESVLECGAAILLLAWAVWYFRNFEAKIYWSSLNAPLLGLIGLGCFQLIFRTTAYAFLTQTELLKLSAYFLIFFLSAQAFRERKDLNRLLWFLVVLSFAVSLLGIIQHFTSEGEIYWFRHLQQGGDVFGPYVNRNHFAGFIELTAPVGLALLIFRGVRRELFYLLGLLTVVPLGALILSASRGGLVGFGLAVGVLIILARSRGHHEGERPQAAVLAIVALAALALMAWLGAGRVIQRFALPSKDVSLQRRGTMLLGAAHIFVHHPITGSGLGTLVSVFPRYDPAYDGKLVDHVHDDYAELLAEMGLLGGICGLIFLWRLFRDSKSTFESEQGHFSYALHAGAIAAISAMLLHSFVDFNLHIPSNANLFLLQAYLATSSPLPSEGNFRRERRQHSLA
ncbi:MAG TPA: O-antigen ligase family protein [Candidatus Acidoferrum sp.]|nr:O-antigen ligase family protein [Candidatus Acidoferrum sp.]